MKSHHKYLIQCSVLYVIYFILAALLLFFYPSVLSFVLCLLINLPCKLLVTSFANKNLINILSNELNAQKFYNAIYQKPFHPSILYQLNAEWYIGNYKKMIALSLTGFKNSKSIHRKCIYLVYLARAYFDIRDYEKLNETVDSFYQLQEGAKKKEKLLSRYPIFKYYKTYLNGDFEHCISISQLRMEKIQKKRSNGKLLWLTNQINLAIAYYELEEFDKAKEIFLWFVKTTPNLNNFYKISVMYLEAIEKNISPCSTNQPDEEENAQVEHEYLSFVKKKKKKKAILYILIIVLIGAFAVLDFFKYSEKKQGQGEYNSAIIEYENDLNNAIAKNYDDANFIKYFNLTNKHPIDTFCLIEVEDRLDLVSIVTFDGGESLDLVLLIENIQIPYDYSVKSAVSDNQITFSVTDEQMPASNDNEIIEFSSNNKDYWIEIKSITPLS